MSYPVSLGSAVSSRGLGVSLIPEGLRVLLWTACQQSFPLPGPSARVKWRLRFPFVATLGTAASPWAWSLSSLSAWWPFLMWLSSLVPHDFFYGFHYLILELTMNYLFYPQMLKITWFPFFSLLLQTCTFLFSLDKFLKLELLGQRIWLFFKCMRQVLTQCLISDSTLSPEMCLPVHTVLLKVSGFHEAMDSGSETSVCKIEIWKLSKTTCSKQHSQAYPDHPRLQFQTQL